MTGDPFFDMLTAQRNHDLQEWFKLAHYYPESFLPPMDKACSVCGTKHTNRGSLCEMCERRGE